uniref:Serpin domain-containing protein n=1 Tax=Capra hircus TaxID=9925 RepID=A0A8C2PJ75_CAPHI
MEALRLANSAFAVDLYKQLCEKEPADNILFSPICLSTSLSLAQVGAKGDTADEIGQVLHFENVKDVPFGFQTVTSDVNKLSSFYSLKLIKRLYVEKSLNLSTEFISSTKRPYAKEMETVDFKDKLEETKGQINNSIKELTDGHFENILADNSVNDQTKILVVNAAYFVGKWMKKFPESETKECPFRINKTVIRFTMDSLIAANTKFCFDLFQKISTDDCRKNIFFCPLSLSAALGMVRLGARSGSARQIDQVLHFSEFSQNKGNKPDPCLKKAEQEGPGDSNLEGQKDVTGSLTLQTESSKDESGLLSCYFGQLLSKLARIKVDYTLSIANRLYGEREFPICPEYLDGVIQFYHTTVESVDFRKDTEKSRQEINFWVESQSQGKIKELFSKDSINNKTVLVLVNAVYFKAKWEKYFDCENTVDAVFSLSEVPEHSFLDIHSEFPRSDGWMYTHI